VLLALCHGQHAHHEVVRDWLDGARQVESVALCRVTQLGLCRLLSNRAVMGEAVLDPKRAWKMGQRLLEDDRFVFLEEGREIERWIGEFLGVRRSSPNLWTDAYLAAFAASAGIELVTLDRDFAKFDGLDCKILIPDR
jgi:toxin-antitoxin system PIN domain toxin